MRSALLNKLNVLIQEYAFRLNIMLYVSFLS